MSRNTSAAQETVLFQGFMRKEGGSVKSWRRRFFELTRRHLHYYRSTSGNTRAEHLNSIEIGSIVSLKSHEELYRGYDFLIVLETDKRTYWLSCESRHEQRQWMQHIACAREDKFPSEHEAPHSRAPRMPLSTSQQFEIARCAVEIFNRSQADLPLTPHEDAYLESLKFFHAHLTEHYASRDDIPWDYALATCLLVLPQHELTPTETCWLQNLHTEYNRYSQRIKDYNDKSASRLLPHQEDDIIRNARRIFHKAPSERSQEETQYIKDLRASFWRLYRIERENGVHINHSKISETLKLLNQETHSPAE